MDNNINAYHLLLFSFTFTESYMNSSNLPRCNLGYMSYVTHENNSLALYIYIFTKPFACGAALEAADDQPAASNHL